MTVVIVDDDALVLSSLETILKANNIDIVAKGNNGEEAVSLFKKHKPDLLLMDIRMEKMNGIDATEKILAEFPEAKILLLTTFQDEEYITKALKYGCKGYILKQNISMLIPAINAVYAGGTVFDSEIIEKLPSSKPERKTFEEDLTEKETDILEYVAEGLNNKEIAERLSLSEGTVRNYVSTILEKLNLRSRTQLVVYYYTKV